MKISTVIRTVGSLAVADLFVRARTQKRSYIPKELRLPFTLFRSPSFSNALLPVVRILNLIQDHPVTDVSVRTTVITSEMGVSNKALIYRPLGVKPNGPVFMYIHGGGTFGGAPQILQNRVSAYARDLDMVAVAIQYRLSPMNPYPAPLDDAYAAYHWIRNNAAELDIDPARVIVFGESAGGLIAAGLTHRLLDTGDPMPVFQVLSQPMLDDRTTLKPKPRYRGQIAWTPKSNRYGWTSYLGRRPQHSQPESWATPARRKDLAGLPPAWIGVGTLDLFHDEDAAYAERLNAAGVPCQFLEVTGGYHGFDTLKVTSIGKSYRDSFITAARRAVNHA